MKLGVMQPYFFPYIGYFQLLNEVDRWIAFDDIQFIDKGWINRNRILHPDPAKEWQFITLPLARRGQFDNICDIFIKTELNWRAQILGKLTLYRKKAPYYRQVIDLIHNCFEADEQNLSKFVIRTLRLTADYLGIKTVIEVQSETDLNIGSIDHAGQWALRIAEAVHATEYINLPTGKGIFKQEEFDEADIKLSFLEPALLEYPQIRGGFVSGLSIIDVMMFNSPEAVRELLREYRLVGLNS